MIYSNVQSVIFPTKTAIGDHVIFLGMDGPSKVEIPCTRDTLITHGMNRDINIEISGNRKKELFIKDFVEDWREPDDPRWHIPTDVYLFLQGYKSSSLLPGHTEFQAYCKDKKRDKSPLQCFKRWKVMDTRERAFSIGGIYRLPPDTLSIVRIIYTGSAKVPTRYLISFDGTQVQEYSENSSKLMEALNDLGISQKGLAPNWNDNWYNL